MARMYVHTHVYCVHECGRTCARVQGNTFQGHVVRTLACPPYLCQACPPCCHLCHSHRMPALARIDMCLSVLEGHRSGPVGLSSGEELVSTPRMAPWVLCAPGEGSSGGGARLPVEYLRQEPWCPGVPVRLLVPLRAGVSGMGGRRGHAVRVTGRRRHTGLPLLLRAGLLPARRVLLMH